MSAPLDGAGAMAVMTAWIGGDEATVTALFDEAADGDPRPMLFGLGYLAATTIQAYAAQAELPVPEVLQLLGGITARRVPPGPET